MDTRDDRNRAVGMVRRASILAELPVEPVSSAVEAIESGVARRMR